MAGGEFNTIVLAALLHDVGKLLQRGRSLLFDIKGRHPEVSARFVAAFQRAFSDYAEPSLLQTLVLHHHRTIRGTRPDDISDPRQRTLAFLINKADGLSASERGQRARGGRDYKTTPLAPVFERVALTAKRRDEPRTRYHPKPLTSPRSMDYGLFPDSFTRYAPGELEELLLEFGRASYPVLQQADFASFDSLVLYLLNLLQTYAWPVPSDTQSLVPDVSLFDHLRSTAAIAGCLYRFHDAKGTLNEGSLKDTDKEAFLLAAGDLSGIQSYIFDIATGDEVGGGVARRLRARSLFVQLLSTVVSHHVLRRLRLPPTHLLMASGGKFYLLLPNLPETLNILGEIRREADTWCLEVLRGEVAMNLAWVPFNEAQLRSTAKGGRGFGAVIQKATAALAILKEQELCFGLVSGNRWNEEGFILSGFDGGDVCPSCGKFPRLPDEELCKRCGLDQRWGARLPRAKYIAITPASSSGELDIFGYGVSLCECAGDVPADASLVLAINNPGAPSVKGAPTSSYHLVTQVPTEERERESVVLTWSELAQRSRRRPYLGFLKVDADRLGQVFAQGLADRDTISRQATLSREIDLFFSGWVQHLLTESRFSDCYPVFCGGDDVFVVGPWDAITNLAGRIREDYRVFTAYNPDMTLSAGVLIAESHYPVCQAAKEVEKALGQAKERGRDRISILGTVLTWRDWGKVYQEWERLHSILQGEQAPSALLHRLLKYGQMWRAYRDGRDPLGLRAQPLLAYYTARTIDARHQPQLSRCVEGLVSVKPLDNRQRFLLDHLSLLAQLLILSKEGGEGR